MAERGRNDQLQPSLLDRLRDDEPQNPRDSNDRRVMSLRALREAVLRDLAWLLNTENLTATEDLEDYPLVAESVLNYGVPSFAGHTISNADVKRVEGLIRDCVCRFEPRLLKDTVKVKVLMSADRMNRNAMSFDIEGQLWAQPLPLRLLLRSQLDLDTGEVKVTDRGSG
jgi:type VI secretion system protein ImpF